MVVNQLKLVFAGAVGSGKTTAIESVSDVETFTTEEGATDDVQLMKATTTVALDYGQMKLEDGSSVHLYGTPGQQRFDFMWEILAKGAIGVLIFIDSSRDDCAEQLQDYLNAFSEHVRSGGVVVIVTHTDLWQGVTLGEIRSQVNNFDSTIPTMAADARCAIEVGACIKALLYNVTQLTG